MFAVLSRSPLFRGIRPDELEVALGQVNYKIRNYTEDNVVNSRNDECTGLTIMLEGSVRGEMLDYSGKILKIEDIEAPRPLAVAFLFGKNNFYPVDIITNEPTEILSFPKESVIELMQKSSIFLKNYMDVISSRAQFLSERITFFSFQILHEQLLLMCQILGDEVLFCNRNHWLSCFQLLGKQI